VSNEQARIAVKLGTLHPVYKAYEAAHDAAGSYLMTSREVVATRAGGKLSLELLDLASPGATLQLEAKAHADPALARRTARAVCERLRDHPARERTEIISFWSGACELAAELGFRARLVIIADYRIHALAAWGRHVGLHGVCVEHFLLSRAGRRPPSLRAQRHDRHDQPRRDPRAAPAPWPRRHDERLPTRTAPTAQPHTGWWRSMTSVPHRSSSWRKTQHGALAVGISAGKPFAVSNLCRHLFAPLGKGRVTDDGCPQCPWHAALYDVSTGAIVRGPQGAFKPSAGTVKATTGARSLTTFPVKVRDGAVWLVG
jgi:nitrite reductase/ring-hydroxylating ferredoxin subunit